MRRNANSSRRLPPSHAKRSRATSAWPNGVCASRMRPSRPYGIPSEPNAVSSGARRRSSDGQTTPIARAPCPRRGGRGSPPDQLERAARAGAFEEPDRALERWGLTRCAGAEEGALEMCERGPCNLARARRQLLDPTRSERSQILRRPGERGEGGPARLVRKRHRHLRAAGEGLQQRPFRAGEVLEPVGEHGLAVPGPEIAGEPLGAAAPLQVAVPEPQCIELIAVAPVQAGQVAVELGRIEEPGLELRDAASSASAKPAKRADLPRPFSSARAIARLAINTRCASVATRRTSRSSRTRRSKRSSKVPIEPARSTGVRRNRSRSTRSTSGRFGTIRPARARAIEITLEQEPDLAGIRRSSKQLRDI